MSPVRVISVAAALLVLGPLFAGCADDSATSGEDPSDGSGSGHLVNATLPENLCDEVLPAVPSDYGVDEVAHESHEGSASCRLASESGATTLQVTLTSAEPGALDDAFATACDAIGPDPDGRQERRCTATTDLEVVQATSLSSRSAVLLMTLRSDDAERIRTGAIDLALVESAVASS